MLKYHIRIWYEWIDSNSNPADGLSRDGLLDEWTVRQGWELANSESLRWHEMMSTVPVDRGIVRFMTA